MDSHFSPCRHRHKSHFQPVVAARNRPVDSVSRSLRTKQHTWLSLMLFIILEFASFSRKKAHSNDIHHCFHEILQFYLPLPVMRLGYAHFGNALLTPVEYYRNYKSGRGS